MTALYIMIAIIILLMCYLIFQTGRIYEHCIAIRDIDDKLDELNAEVELLRQAVIG